MINLVDFQNIDQKVSVTLTDNEYIEGFIVSIDDEEESGLDEVGITLCVDGKYIGIGQSEIEKIEIKENK